MCQIVDDADEDATAHGALLCVPMAKGHCKTKWHIKGGKWCKVN